MGGTSGTARSQTKVRRNGHAHHDRPGIEGRPVIEYLDIVTAQGVLGVNAFKDVSAGVAQP